MFRGIQIGSEGIQHDEKVIPQGHSTPAMVAHQVHPLLIPELLVVSGHGEEGDLFGQLAYIFLKKPLGGADSLIDPGAAGAALPKSKE